MSTAPTGVPRADRRTRAGLLIAGIVLVAANLRAALTSVGPLVPTMEHDLDLSSTAAGVLTTLPVFAFGAMSPLVPRIAHRIGDRRTIGYALVALTIGILLRSVPATWALFAGTALLGAAIACGNVLLPAVIKQRFPARVATLTGVYATTMGVVASIASGVVVPIAGVAPGGWRTALGCWAGLALVGFAMWGPQLTTAPFPRTGGGDGQPVRIPWRSALAWQVTGFMGLQSLAFYTVIGWLPSILHAHGYSTSRAGWLLFGFQIVGMVSNNVAPAAARRFADQRAVAVGFSLFLVVGFTGLLTVPRLAVLWSVVAGLGSGGSVVLALSFVSLRAPDARHAATLSGMAQSIGYLVAASGPLVLGLLHDLTGSWRQPLAVLVAAALLQALFALGAGRNRHVG